MSDKNRERFGSRLGFILVSAGCAIGIGSVWKFPYLCGQFGGASFMLIFLFFLLILGIPVLVCELAMGRAAQKSAAKAFDVLEKPQTSWHYLKWISLIGCYLLMMFYRYRLDPGLLLEASHRLLCRRHAGRSRRCLG